MIAGIGIDVVDLAGFRAQLEDPASSFVAGTFTALELADVETRPAADRALHLAARFAAREAFLKAWSSANRGRPQALASIDMREIEVVTDARHRPSLRLHGRVGQAVAALGLEAIHLSLSHDGGYAVAMVVLERGAGELGA